MSALKASTWRSHINRLMFFGKRLRHAVGNFRVRRRIGRFADVVQAAFDLADVFEILVEAGAVGGGKRICSRPGDFLRDGIEQTSTRPACARGVPVEVLPSPKRRHRTPRGDWLLWGRGLVGPDQEMEFTYAQL